MGEGGAREGSANDEYAEQSHPLSTHAHWPVRGEESSVGAAPRVNAGLRPALGEEPAGARVIAETRGRRTLHGLLRS